ncbi:hypothetical protein SAMD00019534_083480 [Acytostelium subglobosum LB1]|uniref:hypothetical protein n=1 Tax=Acytostelium subglobosum LB1 TaxID=1410327 RepID=UPI000644DAE7|nr:hypothetical protein SAMD00019534_083480 [Acytostelium subglobosum LB1]GAM25173.1 hypothetical protein SAMD00019534_083480 [Acytostelium subglobosum LB1]|eukprot:XP_012751693.1 hypothetical protein SAMD00019534_083480 [Acytostelium subglobosum LB1]
MSELCATCNKTINSSRIRAKGKLFHEECFVCTQCQVSLDCFFYKDGKLYCDTCEVTLFAKRCDKCTNIIQNTVVNVRGKNYHPDCFTCHRCTSIISKGFLYIEGNFVCNKCDASHVEGSPSLSRPTSTPSTPPTVTISVSASTDTLSEYPYTSSTTSSPASSAPSSPAPSRPTSTQLQPPTPSSTSTSTNNSPSASPQLSRPSRPTSQQLLQPIEKFVPMINGKSMPELLRQYSFDDILSNVLTNKIIVHKEIKMEELQMNEVIAAGASGKVHRGVYKGRDVAIKVYSVDNLCFSREEFDREVSIMSLLNHECFTEFYGANTENSKCLLHLSEFVKGGTLRDLLLNKDVQLSFVQKLSLALDVANAMEYLHSLGVIHRDLKSGNVLVTEEMRAKVIDFGTSRAIDPSKQMTLNLGTSCWMAPEVFRNEPYTELCDVYSFGIVLWEIFCRKDPYDGVNSWSIPVMVTKGERPQIPSDCPSDYCKLIKECWVDKAKKRPRFKEIKTKLTKMHGKLSKTKK